MLVIRQQQPLVDRVLQATVRRLDIAVLVRIAGEVAPRTQTVMVDQFPISFGEVPAAALREFMSCRRQIIGAMFDRDAAQAPECVCMPALSASKLSLGQINTESQFEYVSTK